MAKVNPAPIPVYHHYSGLGSIGLCGVDAGYGSVTRQVTKMTCSDCAEKLRAIQVQEEIEKQQAIVQAKERKALAQEERALVRKARVYILTSLMVTSSYDAVNQLAQAYQALK